jgi:hypothetical protein
MTKKGNTLVRKEKDEREIKNKMKVLKKDGRVVGEIIK